MTYFLLANHLRDNLRDDDAAIAEYRIAIGLDSEFAEAWCNLAGALDRSALAWENGRGADSDNRQDKTSLWHRRLPKSRTIPYFQIH